LNHNRAGIFETLHGVDRYLAVGLDLFDVEDRDLRREDFGHQPDDWKKKVAKITIGTGPTASGDEVVLRKENDEGFATENFTLGHQRKNRVQNQA